MNSEKIFKSLGINGGAKRSTVDAVARAEALIKIKDNLSVTKLMKYEPITSKIGIITGLLYMAYVFMSFNPPQWVYQKFGLGMLPLVLLTAMIVFFGIRKKVRDFPYIVKLLFATLVLVTIPACIMLASPLSAMRGGEIGYNALNAVLSVDSSEKIKFLMKFIPSVLIAAGMVVLRPALRTSWAEVKHIYYGTAATVEEAGLDLRKELKEYAPKQELPEPVKVKQKVIDNEFMAVLDSVGAKDIRLTDIHNGHRSMEYFVKLPLEMSPSFFTNERLVTIGSKLASSNIQFTPIIEGKPSTVGFIVPKAKSEPVDYMDGIRSKEFTECDCVLPMLVGADTNRNYIVIDMAKMPHLLIAGESGGGKSMLLVAMLLSLLSRVSSDELELIVVDPKLVEMAQFSGLPHLQGRDIITEPRLAQKAFKELCVEMDTRYALIANEIKRTGKSIKNIQGYNKSIKNSGAVDANGKLLEPIKSIVLIVDEYADLAMTCDKQLMESYIQRLGQKARAANIHIILVTQRPSVDVITGNIKTNLVGRISLKTKSVTDSRIILGEGGAETLMGAGDLILSHSSYGGATRVFGAYIPESLEESILSELKNK